MTFTFYKSKILYWLCSLWNVFKIIYLLSPLLNIVTINIFFNTLSYNSANKKINHTRLTIQFKYIGPLFLSKNATHKISHISRSQIS